MKVPICSLMMILNSHVEKVILSGATVAKDPVSPNAKDLGSYHLPRSCKILPSLWPAANSPSLTIAHRINEQTNAPGDR